MKTPILCLVFALSGAALLAEVAPGDTLEQATATLGAPRGRLQLGDRTVLYFERGELEVLDGRVTRVDLRTPEENASMVAREEQQRSAREERRQQWIAAGTAERDRKLADENFRSAPLRYQVSYWQDFAVRYPDVSVLEPLTIARLKLNEHLEKKQQEDRTAERVAQLEQELAAQKSQSTVYPLFTGYSYGRYRPYYSPNLGPFKYDFFAAPLPPYSTPSGNPAGDLYGPNYTAPTIDPSIYRRGN